jgi:hypothetical protein
MEKRAAIKSSVRIIDSDDDEEADRDFFERERELRERMAQKALDGDLPEAGTRKKAKKKSAIRPRKLAASSPILSDFDDDVQIQGSQDFVEDRTDEESENGDIESVIPPKKPRIRRAVEISSDEE